MTFQEIKNSWFKRITGKKPYTYRLLGEDIIGEVEFDTPKKLTPDQADAVLLTILKLKGKTGKIGDIDYRFNKAPDWEEE